MPVKAAGIFSVLIRCQACIFEKRASCNTWEKLIPIAMARSFSHDGMVKVFFTAFVSLYWLMSQDTREEKPSSTCIAEMSEGAAIAFSCSKRVRR